MHDIIIIGGGPSGLFFAANAPKRYRKLILEKNKTPGSKLVASGGGRGNITNMNIDLDTDYFGANTKFVYSIFHRFGNKEMLEYLSQNGVSTKIEDNGRVMLGNENTKSFLNFLTQQSQKNNTEILTNQNVIRIYKEDNIFYIQTQNHTFSAHKVVISTGGKSFPDMGTTGDGLRMAGEMNIDIIKPYKGLVGITTREDTSELSGNSINANITICDQKKKIYSQNGALLFTHYGVSGPTIFNATLAIGQYLRKKFIYDDEDYIKQNINIIIDFDISTLNKKMLNHFKLSEKNTQSVLNIENINSWKEAKVTGGGISVKEISTTFESKKISGLYFIGEILDITGKTGGYNLQRCRSSAYVCAQNI